MDLRSFGVAEDFTQLPAPENKGGEITAGEYLFKIESVKTKPGSKFPEDTMLSIQHNIESADFTNRKVFDNFTLKSPDNERESEGNARIGEFMRLVGINDMNTDTWIGKLFYGTGKQNGSFWNINKRKKFENSMSAPSAPSTGGKPPFFKS